MTLKESDSDVMATVYDVLFDFLVLPGFGTFFGPGFIIIPCSSKNVTFRAFFFFTTKKKR